MKKFVNLSRKYKKFIDQSQDIVNANNFTRVEDKISTNLSLKELINLCAKVQSISDDCECSIYEVNNLMKYYSPKSDNKYLNQINVMKMLFYERNKKLAYQASKTTHWKNNIERLTNYCNEKFAQKCSPKLVELAFRYLISKNKYNLLGSWSIIDFNKNGEVKSIEVFDLDDYDKILLYIVRKKKWKLKNSDEWTRLRKIIQEKREK